jgi:hypothetical protein
MNPLTSLHTDEADDLSPLLSDPFARAWSAAGTLSAAPRAGLATRLAGSREREAGMTTTRLRRTRAEPLGGGVAERLLYRAEAGRPLRAGEPLRARLLELAPGAQLACVPRLAAADAEWLVLDGELSLGTQRLGPCDYLVQAADDELALASGSGARVFVRESPWRAGTRTQRVLDAEAGWPDYGPGIRRRVLWQQGDEAALLYRVEAGAFVPDHVHGHDEECLMVAGELFLDDVLMQAGDYQIAPVGSHHLLTRAETAGILYGHGDLNLRFV